MLLTEQDIALAWIGINDPMALGVNFKDSEHVKNFAANLEAAILAKLANAELPEPVVFDGSYLKNGEWEFEDGYTADQLRQAYAQGAASQLAEKPKCWAIFTEDGNARMWSTFQPHVQKLADAEGLAVIELYTRKEASK